MAAYVLLFSLFVFSSATDLRKVNELKENVTETTEIIMEKVEEHCKILDGETIGDRKKRDISGDDLRYFIRSSLSDCEDVNPTSAPPEALSIAGPCNSEQTVNLTGYWRKDLFGSHYRPVHGMYACDRELQLGTRWFRFTGDAGIQLSNRCPQAYSCGGHGGFWSNAAMPTTVGEIRSVPIYGSWNGDCSWYTWPTQNSMYVQRCSDRNGDFVYKVRGTGSCYWTFCGMDAAAN